MWRKAIYDIESLRNLFILCDSPVDDDSVRVYVIHESRNDLEGLLEYLTSKVSHIGFNNLNYDAQLTQYILDNRAKLRLMRGAECANNIYKFSQEVIALTSNGGWPPYPKWKLKIPQLDLFKIWHFDNKARRASLKWVQFMIDWYNVEEMPIPHTSSVPEEKIPEVVSYCINDVLSTKEFYKITIGKTDLKLFKGKDKIELRKNIKSIFGIDCLNFNDVKIGDEINKINYLKRTGLDWYEIKGKKSTYNVIKASDCIAPFIEFKSEKLTNFLDKIRGLVFSSTKGEFEEAVEYKGVTFTFAQGGIHSVDNPRIIIPRKNQKLEDRDVRSLYPDTIIKLGLYPAHLGPEWLIGYKWTYDERVIAKDIKGDPKQEAISEAYKLGLNGGGYGKTGEESSWQYDPKVMMTVTITNQLALLMLCEDYLDNGIEVISANTDGVLILFDKDKDELVKEIDREWMKKTGYFLEYAEFLKFVQNHVNSYIALKTDGKTKKKGQFATEHELHKDKSQVIVPIALENYYIKGIPFEKTILEHRNIYDFLIGVKAQNGWYYEARWEGEDHLIKQLPLQKVTRYFISRKGVKIMKCNPSGKESQANAGHWRMTIFNTYYEVPWDDYKIDYDYYIQECYRISSKIKEPKPGFKPLTGRQGELF